MFTIEQIEHMINEKFGGEHEAFAKAYPEIYREYVVMLMKRSAEKYNRQGILSKLIATVRLFRIGE